MSISPLRGSPLASPEHGPPRANRGLTRSAQQPQPKCAISLERVVGNTVNGPNGFSISSNGAFAVCAGSTAVVSTILADSTIKQQIFRSPGALKSDTNSGFDSIKSSPFKSRSKQSLRASILPPGPSSPDGKELSGNAAVYRKPKGTTCLALSLNGQYLAVGETGYAPRILLYSLTSTVDSPLSTTSEHISGIQTLCFSPDSKWLCSVGDIYDGCIYIWSITAKGGLKLHSSSKCTSTIYDTKWVDQKSIITAGVRHLKIWRPDIASQQVSNIKTILSPRIRTRQESPAPASPGPVSLSGRSVLLDALLESTFTTVCYIGRSRALVGSETGAIGIFEIAEGTQKLRKVVNLGVCINCMVVDSPAKTLFLATSNATLWTCDVSQISSTGFSSALRGGFRKLDMNSSAVTMGCVEDKLLWIDENRCLSVHLSSHLVASKLSKDVLTYPAHCTAINGSVQVDASKIGSFDTYDSSGRIASWNSALSCAGQCNMTIHSKSPSLEYEPNELKVVRYSNGQRFRICGDKYGCLSLLDTNWQVLDQVQAHTSDINDIALIEALDSEIIVVTCSRDRIIQVYRLSGSRVELVQSIDQHNGSVNKLEVIDQDGPLLLSLSSDRTIVAHKLVSTESSQAFLCVKIMTLKSTPLSCAMSVRHAGLLAVTTSDKQLQMFHLKTGLLENSIRLVDEEDQIGLQDVVLRSVGLDERQLQLLVGISHTDKTIRMHNALTGETLCKAGGHSEFITSMTTVHDAIDDDGKLTMKLATTSLDGTVMLWNLSCQIQTRENVVNDGTMQKDPRQTPLRKVLSRSQLAGFAATIDPSEWSPLPSPSRERPFFRATSPERLHRRTSVPNLLRNSPTPILAPPTPRQHQDSPLSPDLSHELRRRSMVVRSTSPGKDRSEVSSFSKLLVNSLRSFRMASRSSSNILDEDVRNELKLELELTLNSITSSENNRDDSEQPNSYFPALSGIQSMTIAEDDL